MGSTNKEIESAIYAQIIMPLIMPEIERYVPPKIEIRGQKVRFYVMQFDPIGEFHTNYQRSNARTRLPRGIVLEVGGRNHLVGLMSVRNREVTLYERSFPPDTLGRYMLGKLEAMLSKSMKINKVNIVDEESPDTISIARGQYG